MARRGVADTPLARLARQRGGLRTAHFALGWSREANAPGDAQAHSPHLGQAVPKRWLKRAVDRNALRRVAREAWRARAADRPLPAPIALLKLLHASPEWSTLGASARKRQWRAELDSLFQRWN